MADTKEADSKHKVLRKKGLHGWKAALAVFGCGTMAAFLVFGVIAGVASLFFSSVREGFSGAASDGAPQVIQTGVPFEQLEPGEMDICVQDIQYVYTPGSSSYASENYEDPALDGNTEDRVISDTCSWEIYPDGDGIFDPWFFEYSYEAVVSTPDGRDRVDVASEGYDAHISEIPGRIPELISSGDASYSERSYYFYGKDGEGNFLYYLVGQTKSTVYVIHYESSTENVDITWEWFHGEAGDVASYVEPGLGVVIPD
ncbi:MAG: hypothetical protein JK586_10815 [Nocardiopsis sp. BM-2018]|nr:MAG: hypothetical protein JK586_10815 [Nocardiopsis sp. BM-2018]